MQPLDLARIYAAQTAAKEQNARTRALEGPRTVLDHWIARLLDCKTLTDIQAVLTGFSEMSCWSILDKSLMSAHYTPRVLKLIKELGLVEDEKKYLLEDLAERCWKPGGKND